MVSQSRELIIVILLLSETVQLALVAAIGGFVTGLIPSIFAYLSLQTARLAAAEAATKEAKVQEVKLAELVAEQKLVTAKADHIIEQGMQIHTLTNSTLSATKSELSVANETIKGQASLIKSMVESKKVADELSTKKVDAATVGTADDLPAQEAPVPVVDDQLPTKIDRILTPKLDKIQDTVDEKG